jgi:outer membrane lipoprotein SlyB
VLCSPLIGGKIGEQFGSGSALSTILGTILGIMLSGSMANNSSSQSKQVTIQLVGLMVSTDNDGEFMMLQYFDPAMRFQAQDKIRMIYLGNGFVCIDKQY